MEGDIIKEFRGLRRETEPVKFRTEVKIMITNRV
jgi:hypothetical protein